MKHRPKSGYVVAEITNRWDELLGRRYHVTRFLVKTGAGMYELREETIHSLEEATKIAARWRRYGPEKQRLRVLRVRSFADQKRRAYLIGWTRGFYGARTAWCDGVHKAIDGLEGALKPLWVKRIEECEKL